MMIRFSVLRNYPVICGSKKIGLLQSMYVDEEQTQVVALMITCGFRGRKWVHARHILAVSECFILIACTDRLDMNSKTQLYPFVRDTSGRLLGRIVDYAIDEQDFEILAVEMMGGYLPCERRQRTWIYEYKHSNPESNELIVPAELGLEPRSIKEEDGICASQR